MKQRLIFIGDFSGLSLFLSRGVSDCDVEAVLYSNGDGWKGIPRSNQLFKAAGNQVRRAWNQVEGARSILSKLRSDDTLVLSTEFLFNRWIDAPLLLILMKKVRRTVLLHAGCSDGFHRLNAENPLCINCKKYDINSDKCVFDNNYWPGLAKVLKSVDTIVPFTDVYIDSAQMFGVPASRVTAPLHFPIDFNYVHSQIHGGSENSNIIHGQNRPGFKGTAYLKEMMIGRPSLQALINLLPRMSFVEFINRIGSADIVLDQLFANGYGMTGALALATGTSVMYGHTAQQPACGFDGPGCIPVRITGNDIVDAGTLEEALTDHLKNLPDRSAVINSARLRHDHIHIANELLKMLS